MYLGHSNDWPTFKNERKILLLELFHMLSKSDLFIFKGLHRIIFKASIFSYRLCISMYPPDTLFHIPWQKSSISKLQTLSQSKYRMNFGQIYTRLDIFFNLGTI